MSCFGPPVASRRTVPGPNVPAERCSVYVSSVVRAPQLVMRTFVLELALQLSGRCELYQCMPFPLNHTVILCCCALLVLQQRKSSSWVECKFVEGTSPLGRGGSREKGCLAGGASQGCRRTRCYCLAVVACLPCGVDIP